MPRGVLALCALAMLFMRRHHVELTRKAIEWPDAPMTVLMGLIQAHA